MNAPMSQRLILGNADGEAEPAFAWVGETLAFLRRNRRLIGGCVLAALMLGVIDILLATPRYTASATMVIDTRQAQVFNQSPAVGDAQIESALIESEVEVLRSAGLARRVVADLKLGDDPAFVGRPSLLSRLTAGLRSLRSGGGGASASPTAAEDRLAQQFLGSVSARRVGLTYVIEVDATARDPVLAARLANGLVAAYLAEQLSVKENSLRQAGGWVEARLAELQGKALKADQDVQAFKSSIGMVDTGQGSLEQQELAQLNGQVVAAHGRTIEAQAHLDRVREATASGQAPVETSDLLKSPVIIELREKYLADAQRVAEWSARYGRDHVAVVELRKEMGELQASIDSEMQRIERTAESDLTVAQSGEAAAKAQLDKVIGRSDEAGASRAKLRSLQSAADTYRSLYVSFLQRAMQTAQDVSSPVADAHVVTSAHPPLTRSAPQSKLVLAGAIVLGLAAGFCIALLREVLDRTMRTGADVQAATGLAFLTSLPNVRTSRAAMERYAVDHPESAFGLGVRRLQRRVVQHCEGGSGKSVGVIAAAASSGSSTVAANLAASLVRSGHDAAVLDLSGSREARPAMRAQLAAARRTHELVVVDLPPLDDPSDAHTIFSDIDGLALVVEAGRQDGASLLEGLRAAGVDRRGLLGVVINRAAAAAL